MSKKYYKELKRIGKHFVCYAISRTGILPVYLAADNTAYAKTRDYGRIINGINNMVPCKPCVFAGILKGYKEV